MLRAERQDDGVVAGGRLELEIEGDAEPFPQGKPESPVYPAPKRRMDDQLHAAAVVEEALEDHIVVRWHYSQLLEAGGQIGDDLFGRIGEKAAGLLEKIDDYF